MKIVNITGGLGNQMFQYAFAVYLQKCFPNEDIYIDIQHYNTLFFKKFKGINLHNGFEIKRVFENANIPIAGFVHLFKTTYWMPNYVLSRLVRKIMPIRPSEYVAKYENNYSFDIGAISHKGDCYYEGYWQCIKYYENIRSDIMRHFSHSLPNEYNREMITMIKGCESVGIHVRRGDYLNEPEFRGICNLSYYRKAIESILEKNPNSKFFIFSNDIDWCKHNLVPIMGVDAVFITENKGQDSCWDMFLMTYCKHLIIANSSFSWWGAFLNMYVKSVYAPYPWLNRNCEIDIYPDTWIKI